MCPHCVCCLAGFSLRLLPSTHRRLIRIASATAQPTNTRGASRGRTTRTSDLLAICRWLSCACAVGAELRAPLRLRAGCTGGGGLGSQQRAHDLALQTADGPFHPADSGCGGSDATHHAHSWSLSVTHKS